MTLGPDFGEGDYSKSPHTQDELVPELSVDHLCTVGDVVVVIFEACGSLSSPRSPTDMRKLQRFLLILFKVPLKRLQKCPWEERRHQNCSIF